MKTKAEFFVLQDVRRRLIDIISREHYTFLSTFYSDHIQEGKKTIKDYGKLTMFDIRSELRLRTQILRTTSNQKVKAHFKEQNRRQQELLEKLKQQR